MHRDCAPCWALRLWGGVLAPACHSGWVTLERRQLSFLRIYTALSWAPVREPHDCLVRKGGHWDGALIGACGEEE